MYEVGTVIQEARHRRGWGQRRLAEISGVSQPNLAAIESGTRVPSLAMVARLVRACGLQLRFELEARHADVDTEVAARLDRPPTARLATAGVEALTSAARIAMAGLRLVVDGPLAARLWGAPVPDAAERIWCDHADLGRLREAALRCHYQPVPVRPRYTDNGAAGLRTALADGDQLRLAPR